MKTEDIIEIVKIRGESGNATEKWLMDKIRAELECKLEMELRLKSLEK